ENPQQPFYPWASLDEFEVVDWLSSSGLSQAKINEFLNLSWVRMLPTSLSFSTAKEMYERIEKLMPRGPAWKTETVILDNAPDEPQTLHYRDVVECAEHLFSNPTFSEGMLYEP
ncbi:hypothetical protein BS47DRAFT_1269347, partial [Hydnum rufescens UP504]